ncbi:MAG: AAA family ATPase [Phycisphaerales bacterium]|nr:MAG: AAA family ATPase [Phycisphaerales bacterium]
MADSAPSSPPPVVHPDDVGAGLLGLDADWRVRWCNARAAERIGLAPSRLVGRALGELLDAPDLRERLEPALLERGAAHSPGIALSSGGGSGGASGGGGGGVAEVWVLRASDNGVAQRGDALLATLIDATAHGALERELERLRDQLASSEKARDRLGEMRRVLTESEAPPKVIGSAPALLRALDQIGRVAPTDATVLIHGETGTGKDLVARMIHAQSGRAAQAFIAVNCAALPESLIESELFGHERGSFTGADRQRLGKFELADAGTLFLDEIAELSMAAQAKLLRVLQNGAFERVGGAETIRVDVRLVAATHRDLARQVERGRFREDLFYRLNVFRIEIPPLRERREDLRALVEFLHERHARQLARPALPVSERSMRRVLAYRWPGNIRELDNAVERATLLAEGPELEIELPDAPTPGSQGGHGSAGSPGALGAAPGPTIPRDALLDLTSEQLQRLQIMHALETTGYKVFGEGGAAQKLGVNPQTLLSRMDKFEIPRPRRMRAAGNEE